MPVGGGAGSEQSAGPARPRLRVRGGTLVAFRPIPGSSAALSERPVELLAAAVWAQRGVRTGWRGGCALFLPEPAAGRGELSLVERQRRQDLRRVSG